MWCGCTACTQGPGQGPLGDAHATAEKYCVEKGLALSSVR
jgi:hypothetical protein